MYRATVRYPTWYRVLIGIWGLWFAASLSDAAGQHACPMHGDHAVLVGASAAVADAGHAHSAAHHDGSSHESDGSHHTCTCLGSCCCAPSIVAPQAQASLAVAPVVEVTVAAYRVAIVAVVRRAYSQPFANGPPESVSL
ncbi:MAG: hypothetical protein ABJF01_05755 [bacterium]